MASEKVLTVDDRLEDVVSRLEAAVKPADTAAFNAKIAKLEAALTLARAGLSTIEQLPSDTPHDSGPAARGVLASMAEALK